MIDSHHHFWWTARHTYTWPAAAGDRLARDFTPEDLRPELARCGVQGTVLIQVLHQVAGETEEFLDLSREVDFVRLRTTEITCPFLVIETKYNFFGHSARRATYPGICY